MKNEEIKKMNMELKLWLGEVQKLPQEEQIKWALKLLELRKELKNNES